MLNKRNFLVFVLFSIASCTFNFKRKKNDLCKFKKDNHSSDLFFDGWILNKEDVQLLCD
jgi:hypothetical protein